MLTIVENFTLTTTKAVLQIVEADSIAKPTDWTGIDLVLFQECEKTISNLVGRECGKDFRWDTQGLQITSDVNFWSAKISRTGNMIADTGGI